MTFTVRGQQLVGEETFSDVTVAVVFDWDEAVPGSFPALKPSTTTISLRRPESLLEELKALANGRDVPYQSLLKVFLAERGARERGWRGKKREEV